MQNGIALLLTIWQSPECERLLKFFASCNRVSGSLIIVKSGKTILSWIKNTDLNYQEVLSSSL
jgi:hypothetical protein